MPWDYATKDEKSPDWQYDVGSAALIALAFLESGVPPEDPSLVAAARAIRAVSPRLTKTYAISLVILFLDRSAGKGDATIIRELAYRLLAGQDGSSWGWNYDCPIVKDQRDLLSYLESNRKRTDFGKYEPRGSADNSNTQFAVLALWIARRHNVSVEFALARAERASAERSTATAAGATSTARQRLRHR